MLLLTNRGFFKSVNCYRISVIGYREITKGEVYLKCEQ